MNGLDYPMIEDYLRRLDQASAGLPAEARAELRADITEHLASGLGDHPSDAEVRNLLQQLGSPEQIASAAMVDLDLPLAASPPGPPPPPAPSAGPAPAAWPGPESQFGVGSRPPLGAASAAPSVWGPVEIIAVVGLTAGMFVVPLVGPIVGIVMAWISPRWTRREKAIATGLTALPLIAVVLLAVGLLVGSSFTSSGSSGPAPTSSAVAISTATTTSSPSPSSPTGATP